MTVAPMDLSASQQRRADLNGKPCALVKVKLAVTGAVFEGNVIQPVEYKGGEYWVYMTTGSCELRIKHQADMSAFIPCHVNFNDYEIRALESLSTYELTLLLPNQKTQKLIINYLPATAMVIVDSKVYRARGRIELDLPIGEHNYVIAEDGYESAEASVKLNGGSPRSITESLVKVTAPQQTDKPQSHIIAKESKTSSEHIIIKENDNHTHEQAYATPITEMPSSPDKPDTKQTVTTSGSVYIQAAFQAGTMMGVGANAGAYISDFNVETYVTMTMGKESVPMYNTSTLATTEANISGMIFGVKLGYGIKAGSSVRVTPQVGAGILNVSSDDVGSNAICATAGARLEIALGKNFGITLTPEGQFAVSKKKVFKALEEASSKIKGWGTGAILRVGVYVIF